MKAIVKFLSFIFLGTIVFGCFDQPIFSNIPEIELQEIFFGENKTLGEQDSLVIRIKFKDGDGDLGLSENEINPPYNKRTYFLNDNGKLLTIRSRKTDPTLPAYVKPYYCTNYTESSEAINFRPEVLDASFNIADTVKEDGITYYVVKDTLYFEPNPDHYNITVQYFVKENGSFKEFNWEIDVPNQGSKCGITFDGRFGKFPDQGTAAEGIINYAMKAAFFKFIFGSKPIKLKITIKDRALHKSNTIETNEFTLAGVKK